MSDDIQWHVVQVKKWRTYHDDLDTFQDWEVHRDGSDIVFFKINLSATLGDETIEVCRYDTCHGHLHVHRFWLPLDQQTKDLEDPKHRFPSYVEAFAAAAKDLEDNWDDYRERMKKPKK